MCTEAIGVTYYDIGVSSVVCCCVFFFFQAEDGIRDVAVTGVQTCALPIYALWHRPAVWGFLDKGSVPKRVAQNAIEQVFLYELCFSDIFNLRLKESPSRDLTDLEFTALIYIAVGATNDGIGWLIGASRQRVERVVSGLYQKMKIVSRGRAPQGVPALLESRTRLCYEAMTRGLINANLLREEDAGLRRTVRTAGPAASRLYVNRDWLDLESEVRGRET